MITMLLLGLLLVALTAFIASAVLLYKISHKETIHIKRQKNLYSGQKLYINLCKIPPLKHYLSRIKRRVEVIEIGNDYINEKKALRIAGVSLGSIVVALFLLLLFVDQLYYLFILGIALFLIHQQIQNIFFDKLSLKILLQFEKFLTEVRHHYHKHHMIEEAIYDAIEGCPYEMSLHANRMYETLTSSDVELEMESYNEVAPNRYFKTFLALCYLVMKFGDQNVDDQSSFLMNLNYLKQEINFELLKLNSLNEIFKSMSIIIISPIFILHPLKAWAISNIPEIGSIYRGAYGLITEVVITLSVLIAFYLVQGMRHQQEHRQKSFSIEKTFLKVPGIKNIVDTISVHQYTKTMRLMKVIQYSEVGMNLRIFYARKILFLCVGFLCSVVLVISVNTIRKRSIMEFTSYKHEDVYKGLVKNEDILALHKEIIKYSSQYKTLDQVQAKGKTAFPSASEDFHTYWTNMIVEGIRSYEKLGFNVIHLLLCILFAYLCYKFPDFYLQYKGRLMEQEKEDEVMQFHTIILMLMHIKQLTVEDILVWMEQFSVLFKVSIGSCLNNMENGDLEALEQLKEDEPYIPFTRIIDNLILASSKIPIVEAFDELKIQRNYYLDKRKQDNMHSLKKKELLGKIIAFVPLVLTILLYLLIPMGVFSYDQLKSFTEQTKSFL